MEHQHSAWLLRVYIWLHGSSLGSWVGAPLLLMSLISSMLLVHVISGKLMVIWEARICLI